MTDNNQDLKLATYGARFIAFIIDDVLITLLISVIFWTQLNTSNGDLVSVLIIMNKYLMEIIFIKFIYQAFFIWYFGATIGKLLAKIKVIDYHHFGRVSLLNASLRSAMRIFSEMFFYFGFFLAFFNNSRQTLHDKIAKTLVVNA